MFGHLHQGDKVALISPAAAADPQAVAIVINILKQSGLVPVYFQEMNDPPQSAYGNLYPDMPYASSDVKRMEGFQNALNSEAKAIWVLNGNQGCEKIIAALENRKLKLPTDKKIIVGFSGVTNLHLYFSQYGWPCLHGPVASISKETFDITQCPINPQATLTKIIEVLTGNIKQLTYSLTPLNQKAKKDGDVIQDTTIVGGCLNILVTHMGTNTALKAKDKIVFIEDEPQRPERIETMLMGLIRSGAFNDAKAIIFGSLLDPQLNQERFALAKPILLKRLVALLEENGINIPILHSENFGHGDFNDPLPLGTEAMLKLGYDASVTLKAL